MWKIATVAFGLAACGGGGDDPVASGAAANGGASDFSGVGGVVMNAPLSGLDVVAALLASVAATAIYLAQPDSWPYRWLCVGIVPLAVVARRFWFPVGGDDAVEPRPTAPSTFRTVGGIALMITGGVVALLMGLLVAAMVSDSKGDGVAWAAVPAAIGAAGLAVATVGFRLGWR